MGFNARLFHWRRQANHNPTNGDVVRSDIPIGAETLGRIREALAGRGLELCHAGWVPGARKGKLTLTIDREGGIWGAADNQVMRFKLK